MYKLVELNNMISQYHENKEMRDFFSEVLALRFKGYRENYGDLSVPLDLYDLIGTHLVLAKCENDKLIPICCLRSITQSQAENYQQDFPFMHHMFPEDTNLLTQKCSKYLKENENVCYTNNYTIISDASPEEKQLYSMMFGCFYYNYHKENNIKHFITATSDKFKVYRTRAMQGYSYLNENDELSTFTANHIMGEKFRVMIMDEFSDWSKQMGEKYKSMYDSRIILGEKGAVPLIKAA